MAPTGALSCIHGRIVMRKLTFKKLAAGAVAGLFAFGSLSPVEIHADDAGVVRISDADKKADAPETIEPEADQVAGPVYGPYEVYGHGGYGGYGYGGGPYSQYSSPLAVWTARSGPGATAGTLPPSYGWTPPIRRPLQNKVAVGYQRYWPTQWYGSPGAYTKTARRYPVTYVPTDTMQQGYYYQQSPSWQPRPDMIPPAPWPGHWHRRAYPVQFQHYSQYPQNYGMGYPAAPLELADPSATESAPEPAQEETPMPKSGVEEPAPEA